LILTRAVRVEQAARHHFTDCDLQWVSPRRQIGVRPRLVRLRHRQHLRDQTRFQVGEVEQRVAVARLREVNQPHKAARPHQHVFQIQVAVDRRLRAADALGDSQGGQFDVCIPAEQVFR